MPHLEALMRRNFVEYASYSVLDRAIPDLRDGLKPVQRRLLHTLFEMDDGRYHKVANVIGETMKLHPHGDASIGDALVVLANKDAFIDRQGNFGNLLTGHPAAAARYIECRLTPLARETLFDPALTEFVPSYDGRSREPRQLPAKLPVALMLGVDGIAVGLSTRILPHNLRELWEAQVAWLRAEPAELVPDFPQGGLMDASAYDDGRGRVDVRARIEARDDKRVVIRELPYGVTTESLIASIEAAVQKGRVQVASIQDYTTDRVEIELSLPRGARATEVIPQLYAYTDCSVSIVSNPVVIRDRKPTEMSVGEMLGALTDALREQIGAELAWERGQLEDRRHGLTLERIFIEQKVYRRLERAGSEEAVHRAVRSGMEAHRELFLRPLTDDDVRRLLEIRIRRISAWDRNRNRSQIAEIEGRLAEIETRLGDLTGTTEAFLRDLLERYGEQFPRRTEVVRIDAVDKKAVARPALKVAYDPDSGFLGTAVKGDRFKRQITEYDLLLAIAADGTYRILQTPEKVLFGEKLLHCEIFDPEAGAEFTAVYRDGGRIAYAKRFRIEKFIRNKEYRLIRDPRGRLDLLLPGDRAGIVSVRFAPAPRQRVRSARFDLAGLERTGIAARGTRIAAKPVTSVRLVAAKERRPARGRPSRRPGAQSRLF